MDYQATTGIGASTQWRELGLSESQVKDLESIGATGKTTDGREIDYQAYLSSLNDGHTYQVRCLAQNDPGGCRVEVTKDSTVYPVSQFLTSAAAKAAGPVADEVAVSEVATDAEFPYASIASARVRRVRPEGERVRVELKLFINVGDEQERAVESVSLARGESMLIGTSKDPDMLVPPPGATARAVHETHLHIDEEGRAGLEFRFRGSNKPSFVNDAAGVEIVNAATAPADGVVKGTFYLPGTPIRLSGEERHGWEVDGNSLRREQDGVQLELTDVFRSLDGNTFKAGGLRFSAPTGADTIDLGRVNGRDYQVAVDGPNVVGLSSTKWSMEFDGVLLPTAHGYRVIKFEPGSIIMRAVELDVTPRLKARLDEAFAGGKFMFPATRVLGDIRAGRVKVVDIELGPRRERPGAPLWKVAQSEPELLQP